MYVCMYVAVLIPYCGTLEIHVHTKRSENRYLDRWIAVLKGGILPLPKAVITTPPDVMDNPIVLRVEGGKHPNECKGPP